ncbi:MAG: histidine--tRNA ligase [Anaerolineales bacterium]|uniref:Histidine--tRNA ligase n=1 Tax=Candidatus Desulfolinea nitratireducens TaxID=2841698 RepID=A0A8J6NGZ4_9CHLR|nr:histidine--tRNA ligase [Candidatus Desulfolinea nitratireducens]MBL6961714.1 histidine--tRNA ligase [Anaerolineales bacterium]
MAKNIIPSVKGTREFYPEEMALRNFIYEKVRRASQQFGYQEWEAPYLETLELYAAKSGEELVKEQAFTFVDRGGSRVTLRPELTPSLARMIAKKQRQLTYPLRWWSFGPFWRYERPQKGRSREFFQWNIDMLGPDTPEADAELIAVAASFLKSVGLSPGQATIYVNNRRLMDSQFDAIGIPAESRLLVSNLVDRRNKMKEDAWQTYALEAGLNRSQLGGLIALLENKDLWKEWEDLRRLFTALDALGVSEYVEFDANVVRGLLYYTGTVFEAFDVSGSVRRSLLGGGRYNNLLADVGGDPLSAVGFAMGDVVVGIVLAENGLIPEFEPSPAPVLVTVFSEEFLAESLALSAELRKAGLNVTNYPEPAKIANQFKFANKMGMKIALILGAIEVESGQVAVKDLVSGEQVNVARADVPERIKQILASE